MVEIVVPKVPGDEGADVHRSARWIVTGIREQGEARERLEGTEVGHGARIETPAGSLLLVMDKRPTGYKDGRHKRYMTYNATLTLLLVEETGLRDKPLWTRQFASEKGAFGSSGAGQITKHLVTHPPVADLNVREVEPGPGRPNWAAGPCRWCGVQVAQGAGRVVGHGKEAEVEHPLRLCRQPAQLVTGQDCALCGIACVQGSAEWVQVRDSEYGQRWEARHRGDCARWPSPEEEAQRQEELRLQREEQQEAEQKREAKRKADREAREAKRRAAEEEERRAARDVQERVQRLGIKGSVDVATPFDKGVDPSTRLRLVERRLTLSDDTTVTVWDVETYGDGRPTGVYEDDGGYEPDDRGGRYYRLSDARGEYQRHKWAPLPYTPPKRLRFEPAACPSDPSVKHCDHCGTTSAPGGWMIASLGLSCDDADCYDAMANERGAHARRYHRAA
ncbi:hypothetical protein [Streptomyces sp. NBC_01264]|uniref:hypothetical protein n=1 Tax=Streptomyces sp. NBC_01264 TaxID=2903804 RepID=UPI00224EA2F0|nr:hypothetical protein [Streptomyces sp. NBC_01264]MCX4783877.1 hypothetical protein [Streptomyces sp. NBC_01264]